MDRERRSPGRRTTAGHLLRKPQAGKLYNAEQVKGEPERFISPGEPRQQLGKAFAKSAATHDHPARGDHERGDGLGRERGRIATWNSVTVNQCGDNEEREELKTGPAESQAWDIECLEGKEDNDEEEGAKAQYVEY